MSHTLFDTDINGTLAKVQCDQSGVGVHSLRGGSCGIFRSTGNESVCLESVVVPDIDWG
jgi:hypothetical protein